MRMKFNGSRSMCMRELKLPEVKGKGNEISLSYKKIIDAHWKLFNLMSHC